MKTLIVYETSYGTTKKAAELLKEKLNHETDIIQAREAKNINLAEYDNVAMGGSIRAGQLQKAIRKFASNNTELLLDKKIIFFLCFMIDEKEDEYFTKFPKELLDHAAMKVNFGAELHPENAGKMKKFILQGIIDGLNKDGRDLPELKEENIAAAAECLNS